MQGIGSIVGSIIGVKPQSEGSMGQLPAPAAQAPVAPPTPQAAQQPDQEALRSAAAGKARGAAPASTMLTGPGGVSPGSLSVGKNTLLGA